MTSLFLAAAALLAGPVSTAASGRIVDVAGAPIADAEICEFAKGVPAHCVKVDAAGAYRIEKPARTSLVVRASGFVPTTIDAAPLAAPVALRRAAILRVYVFDKASGRPLSSGRVMIDSASGRRIGDFVPFNVAGVRISTLTPGLVFVRAVADGYEPGGPMPIELFGGEERSVKVEMSKTGPKPR